MMFKDRLDAAKQLAAKLQDYAKHSVVYALPRGGVVLGAEIAKQLQVPLDLILVRKIGHPMQEEYAICAVAESQEPVCNEAELREVDKTWYKNALATELQKNASRRKMYFPGNYQRPSAQGKTAIIVDDGIATGLTMLAAVDWVKTQQPKQIIVAVPVAPQDAVNELTAVASRVLVLDDPRNFIGSVGAHYNYFPQIEDDEVVSMLQESYKGLAE